MMFESMRYFGLDHWPSSGVKMKLNELRDFMLESQFNSVYEMRLELATIRELAI